MKQRKTTMKMERARRRRKSRKKRTMVHGDRYISPATRSCSCSATQGWAGYSPPTS